MGTKQYEFTEKENNAEKEATAQKNGRFYFLNRTKKTNHSY